MARAQGVKHSEVASADKSLADSLSAVVAETPVPPSDAALGGVSTPNQPLSLHHLLIGYTSGESTCKHNSKLYFLLLTFCMSKMYVIKMN